MGISPPTYKNTKKRRKGQGNSTVFYIILGY